MTTYTKTQSYPSGHNPRVPSADPLYIQYLKDLTELGVNVDENLTFIEDLQVWFRICNQPLAGGRPTELYRLDVLYHATAPCDARKVRLDAFDTTDERQKILRGDGHDYLSYLLHKERTYEVVCEEKHFKKTISWSKPRLY
jgi:hypothetical protein